MAYQNVKDKNGNQVINKEQKVVIAGREPRVMILTIEQKKK